MLLYKKTYRQKQPTTTHHVDKKVNSGLISLALSKTFVKKARAFSIKLIPISILAAAVVLVIG